MKTKHAHNMIRWIGKLDDPVGFAVDVSVCEEIKFGNGVVYILLKTGEKFKLIGEQGLFSRLIETGEYQDKSYEVYEEVKNFEWK